MLSLGDRFLWVVVLPTEEENSQEEGLGQAQPGARWTRAGKEGLGQAQPGARWTRAGEEGLGQAQLGARWT